MVGLYCREEAGISAEQLADGLRALGYELAQSELGVLMGTISLTQQGQVAKPAFLASQVDWQDFQHNFKSVFFGLNQSQLPVLRCC